MDKPFSCDQCQVKFKKKYNMIRHRKTHGEKQLVCTLCTKTFNRKNHLERHKVKFHSDGNQAKTKHRIVCEYCTKSFAKKFNLNRHLKLCNASKKKIHNKQKIQQRLKHFSDIHLETIELGKCISECLNDDPEIIEESLPEEDKHALSLYQRSRSTIDTNTITLKPWQSKVLSFIDLPTHREVIWIVGKKGNEGKTFLQNYIRYYFGD
jgi:hypothetical protein